MSTAIPSFDPLSIRNTWNQLLESVETLPAGEAFAMQRYLSSNAADVQVDSQGRILLPKHLLAFAALEYALWTSSCFWVSDTLTNPYFWFDFLLSLVLLLLLPALRKAVDA